MDKVLCGPFVCSHSESSKFSSLEVKMHFKRFSINEMKVFFFKQKEQKSEMFPRIAVLAVIVMLLATLALLVRAQTTTIQQHRDDPLPGLPPHFRGSLGRRQGHGRGAEEARSRAARRPPGARGAPAGLGRT